MRDPEDPWQDQLAAATPNPPPVSDYAEIAQRGMTHLRNVMGWQHNPPQPHPESAPETHTAPTNDT